MEARFETAGPALLRVPVFPAGRTRETWLDLDPADQDQVAAAVGYVRSQAADPVLRDALDVSSLPLAALVDRLLAGDDVPAPRVRRAALAVTRYSLRAATRATPFGLLAGVSLARIGADDQAKVRRGGQDRKQGRPDMGWLMPLVEEWERRPEVARTLRIAVNGTCVERAGRLTLPDAAGADRDPGASTVASVRLTDAVRTVTGLCRHPVPYQDLINDLRAAFPGTPGPRIESLVLGLVEQGFLLTDLRPPPTVDTPLRHVLDKLAAVPDLPELPALREVDRLLTDYVRRPLGAGGDCWRALVRAATGMRTDERPVQVDLKMDVDAVLPRLVGLELERSATALWRLSAPGPALPHLKHYHDEFLERYGDHVLVPVSDVLDIEGGLGPPAGYGNPAGRLTMPDRPDPQAARDELLVRIAQEALLDRRPEVELDEDLLGRLERPTELPPPPALELYAHLLSRSTDALSAGDFTLVLDDMSGPRSAGSTFGRFAGLLTEQVEDIAALVRAEPGRGASLPVQLVTRVLRPRWENVSRVPPLVPHRLPVSTFPGDGGSEVDLDEIAVWSDGARLRLARRGDRQEISPFAATMLNPVRCESNLARLLREIPAGGTSAWDGWSWGAADRLPFLPRVRYGRTVLAPATWRPDRRLADQRLSSAEWRRALAEWRERWGVPELVQVAFEDNCLPLNLSATLHQRLFRDELRRRQEPVREVFSADEGATGWLDGHAGEIVVPLFARAPRGGSVGPAAPERDRLAPAAVGRHLPGGEWLYAKLYAAPSHHDELLAEHLPELLAMLPDGVDRWFFVRYQDPDPHLRLRFHGTPEVAAAALSTVHRWAEDLCRGRLARRLVLDSYEPETARYGGPAASTLAERAFCADSVAALVQLRARLRAPAQLPGALLVAANHVDLLRTVGGPDWPDRLLAERSGATHRAAFTRCRADALRMIDPAGDSRWLESFDAGRAVLAAWAERRPAMAAYGRFLDPASGPARAGVVGSVLHMHHNRLVGVDPKSEEDSFAIARGAVAAHRGRMRSGS